LVPKLIKQELSGSFSSFRTSLCCFSSINGGIKVCRNII
jgi:hypothetical protein